MKLPGLAPGEFHLPEKWLKATACGAVNAVGTDKKNSGRRGQTRRALKRLTVRINAAGVAKRLMVRINAVGANKREGCADKRLGGFLSATKYPFSAPFQPLFRSVPPPFPRLSAP